MHLRHLALMIAMGGLAACGAEDDNETPNPNQPNPHQPRLELAPATAAGPSWGNPARMRKSPHCCPRSSAG